MNIRNFFGINIQIAICCNIEPVTYERNGLI